MEFVNKLKRKIRRLCGRPTMSLDFNEILRKWDIEELKKHHLSTNLDGDDD